ncbi:MAG: DUF4974 domain-containing protein [Chitinophagaceae bacterium]|nr:DUF4974 domain-containing protein [Chitinophagaceae bacterium]
MDQRQQITLLFEKWLDQQTTPAETEQLMDWLAAANLKNDVLPLMDLARDRNDVQEIKVQINTREIADRILSAENGNGRVIEIASHPSRRNKTKTAWIKYAAAILIILGVGTYLWNNNKRNTAEIITTTADIAAPATEKSTITLANGKTIHLDSVSVGIIATEGKISIEKMKDGRIVYHGTGEEKMLYNIISVPRGSRTTSLTLADGTIVFLNTASSLKYPVAFTENERRVEITGEAYFEVAKDAKKKFIVDAGGLFTEVLGTHFNINSYEDENAKKVTLLEGKVKVRRGEENIILEPGQQAQAAAELKLISHVDIDNVMAWKNGKFRFTDAGIEEVMRQLQRWYNIEVVYKEKPTKRFDGGIPRNLSVSGALKVLEATGGVKFSVEGNKVIVMK